MNVLGLQTPQVLVALLIDLKVRLEVFPQRVHKEFLPIEIPVSPVTELFHRSDGTTNLD